MTGVNVNTTVLVRNKIDRYIHLEVAYFLVLIFAINAAYIPYLKNNL